MELPELSVLPRHRPVLDPEFVPASLWNQAYRDLVQTKGKGRPLGLALERSDGTISVFETQVLPDQEIYLPLTTRYVERLVKFLLWQRGGCRLVIGGADDVARAVREIYSASGEGAFDVEMVGGKLYGHPLETVSCSFEDLPAPNEASVRLGRNLDGYRIGFDLGGSDRKAAAVINGEVVFSEEIGWDPYFQSDPQYHIQGILDSLTRAAAHLPRVDAIGGSAAGVYVNNEVGAASLFRGVSEEDFDKHVRRIFFTVMEKAGWSNVPWEVVNDGEVTALAGSMSLGVSNILGISMGTSEAAGYVDSNGNIKPWLNELAFAPIDYRIEAPVDEWSGARGCGVQYFSQQGVGRLIPAAGIALPKDMPLPEKLVEVQRLMAEGDPRARKLYETIGTCFGYAIAHYVDFYELDHLLILGRVTSGEGGEIIIREAEAVLESEFPLIGERLSLKTPSEQDKRHGQAVAAASLPSLK